MSWIGSDDAAVAALLRRHRRGGSGIGYLYIPGMSSLPLTATRADSTTCATYRDSAGIYQTVAANVLRDAHYVGTVRTMLREGAATNLLTYGRDLSNVAWTATSVTVAATVGADGGASSGSRLTATGANGTVIRAAALVHGSAAYAGSFVAKRITGTGNIDLTLDNGSTWTTVTLTAAYSQLFTTQTLANSQFGIRLVTSGDVIDVDFCQDETGAVPSSPIGTAAAAVTRAADLTSVAWSRVPEAGTWYVDCYDLKGGGSGPVAVYVGNTLGTAPMMQIYRTGTTYRNLTSMTAGTSISSAAAATSYGDRLELRPFLTVSGSDVTGTLGQSINGAAEAVAAAGTARALDAAWGGTPPLLYIGCINTSVSNFSNLAIRSIVYVPGPETSMASCRVYAGS